MIQDQRGDTLKRLFRHADLEEKRILEIGCGSGRVTEMYAGISQFAVGIEPAHDALCKAAHKISRAAFVRGSGMLLPFQAESFDCVLFTFSLHHHPDYLAALSEAGRVIPSGGQVLVLEPTPESEIQNFCKVFEDEDHCLIAVERTLPHCDLETIARDRFSTHWEFADFEDAASHFFNYYNYPPDKDKREALKDFLGPQAHAAPIQMTDTLMLTCLRRP